MECALAPKGALALTPTGGVMPSGAFTGLTPEASEELSSWTLINMPKSKDLLATALTNASDFLMSADSMNVPKGCLVVAGPMMEGGATIVKNLYYPGFVAFCVAGTPSWGYLYKGDGIKNGDLVHML